jgi:hypothetical protein
VGDVELTVGFGGVASELTREKRSSTLGVASHRGPSSTHRGRFVQLERLSTIRGNLVEAERALSQLSRQPGQVTRSGGASGTHRSDGEPVGESDDLLAAWQGISTKKALRDRPVIGRRRSTRRGHGIARRGRATGDKHPKQTDKPLHRASELATDREQPTTNAQEVASLRGHVAVPKKGVLTSAESMASANPVPRVTERGAVPLPPNLTIKDADRLARGIRPSWDEVFGAAPPPSMRGTSEPPPARSSRVDLEAHAARAAAPVPTPVAASAHATPTFDDLPDMRSRRSMPAPVVDDLDDDAAVVPVTSSGLPIGKIAIGVGALAVIGVLAFVFTRPSEPKAAATAPTATATAAAAPAPVPTPAPLPKEEAKPTAEAAAVPAPPPEPKPEATPEPAKTAESQSPTATAPSKPKEPKAATPPPPPAAPPPSKPKPTPGGGGIDRNLPF